jgi:hypothetical protein
MTADRRMNRRNYGPREDEPCGSWRPHQRDYPIVNRPRAVCTRRHHPGDPLHHTANRLWWWWDDERQLRATADEPLPKTVIPVRDNNLRTTDNRTARGNDTMTATTALCRTAAYTVCALPPIDLEDYDTWSISVVRVNLGDVWAIRRHRQCLNADGTWEPEPSPSSRTDEWRTTHRFDLHTALGLAETAALRLTVNGHSVADILGDYRDRGLM